MNRLDNTHTVLVTGATGFIGTSTVRHLSGEGFRVLAGIRRLGSPIQPGCDPFLMEDGQSSINADALKGIFAIVHSAGLAHVEMEDDESEYVRVNALLTKELAQAAAAAGIKKFIFLSSTRVLGNTTRANVPIDETAPVSPTGPYGYSKLLAEQYLEEVGRGSPMQIYILRLPVVYGPGAKANIAKVFSFASSSLPNIFVRSRERRSMISLGNLNSAISFLLRRSESHSDLTLNPETMLIRDGHDLGVGEMIDKMRWSQGKRRARMPTPRLLMGLPLLFIAGREASNRILTSFRVREQRLREMGWEPVQTVEQGLAECFTGVSRQRVLLFVITEDWYFVSHRMDLASAALASGYRVHVACRVRDFGQVIEQAGIEVHPLRLSRRNTNPARQLGSIMELRRLYQVLKPDVIHHVALKPIAFGSLAKTDLPIPATVNTFAGMGTLFAGGSRTNAMASRTLLFGLKRVLATRNSWSVVQNRDDEQLFLDRELANPRRVSMIAGSGVDIRHFPLTPLPRGSQLTFTLVARMINTKGIADFVDAIHVLRKEGLSVSANLVGMPDEFNTDSIPIPVLQEWHDSGIVKWHGYQEDVKAIWSNSHVAVLPTRYREGVPKSLLEAAAMGRPLIGCDVPGVRDLIRHGVNGLLVPPNDVAALARAMSYFARNEAMIQEMGMNARETVEERFSNDHVLTEYLDLYKRTLGLRE